MNITDMSINTISETLKEQQFQIETYRNEINRLNNIVESFDRDEEILVLRRTITDQDAQIEAWTTCAEGLHQGIVQTEEQLAAENIGLRALARDAIQRYKDLRGRR